MPRSVFILFTSKYKNKAEVDDVVVARLKHQNYQECKFRVVEIEETIDEITDDTVYVYHGYYIGPYP